MKAPKQNKTILKLFYKILIKPVYGKAMENTEKRRNIHMKDKTNTKMVLTRQSKTYFHDKNGEYKTSA